ncbi:ribonuclease H-like domain-containing protein [Tanacetum coccineum]
MSASTSQDEIPPPPPPPPSSQTPTQQTPHTVSTIKLPILKKGEYDIWAMKMEHYLAHTDYPIWEVIQNRNGPVSISTDTSGQIKVLPPRTAEEIVARERERKARTTLLMALPEDHLAKFHKMTDAKEMWDAIKSRFGGNDESKKMQKYILKQQFEGFSYPNTKGITNDSGTQDNRRRDAWNSGNKDGSRTGQKEDSKALVTVDGEGVDWTNHSEDEDYALMACNNSDSDTEMSAYDKFRLGYGDHRYNGILSYENEVLQSVFKGKESDFENQPMNDRFAEGMHAVPPPMTGNYMPSGPDVEVDDSKFTYVSEPVVNESNVESQPKVRSDAPIIKEYESDSEDECESIPTKQQETPSFANKQVKTPGENVKNQSKNSQKPKVNKNDLGHGFAVRACFVCGSLNHLIRDCDFHEKRMARKVELNNVNTARTSGTKNFSTARQSVNRQTILTSSAMKVNTLTNWGNHFERFYLQRFFKMTTLVLLVRKESNTRPLVRPKQFSWVFFLRAKDETSAILKDFIRQIENQLNQKVKTIRSDNGTEFKNKDVIEFCGSKGIKREYTVSTACYVLNRVLVTKPHNKTPYELLTGKIPIISYIRPFGCHVTILNTIDHLGKFAGKSDEGFLVGYSLQSKAFRVYNLETKRVEENLHITFLENKPNVAGKGPTWLFDLDYLTDSMNYHPVSSENQANLYAGYQEANPNAGTKEIIDAGDSDKENEYVQDCFVLPIWPSYSSTNTPALTTDDKRESTKRGRTKSLWIELEKGAAKPSSTNIFSTVSTPAKASSTNLVNTVSLPVSTASPYEGLSLSDPTNSEEDDSEIPPLEDIYQNSTDGIFTLHHLLMMRVSIG